MGRCVLSSHGSLPKVKSRKYRLRARVVVLALMVAAQRGIALPGPAFASDQPAGRASPRVQPAPDLSWHLDGSLLAAGTAGTLLSQTIPIHRVLVPPEGLDPSGVHWAVDRRVIGRRDDGAARASDAVLATSVAFPILLSVLSAPSGERRHAPLLRVLPYLEAVALNQALTDILKSSVSRPRPYLYSDGVKYPAARGVTKTGNAFLSFPSGHASANWCIVGFGVTDHVLSRPRASWTEHAAVGFVGGALATYTGWLRVRAGQHFPSDVAAGALIGSACGAGVPLLHRYTVDGKPARRPPRGAWLGALGGTLAGAAAALLLAPAVSGH
jgi:membrane-associated phospholipid phosphatase